MTSEMDIDDNDIISQIKECSANEVIEEGLSKYTEYIVESKFPHYIDGLKQVHRRILFAIGPNSERTKISEHIATANKLHPHGEAPIYDALTRMSQSFSVGIPLIHNFGNYGTYSNIKGGQPRYTNICISDFAKDLFFTNVENKTLHMKPNYDMKIMEPEFFIPRLPSALFFNSFTIGMGSSSLCNPLNFMNVCELVQKYSEYRESGNPLPFNFKNLSHLLIPDFPIANILRNHSELITAYSQGHYDHRVLIDGSLKLSKNEIIISTLPFGVSYNQIKSKLYELNADKKYWLNDFIVSINDYTDKRNAGMSGSVTITFRNNVDIFKHLEKIKKIIQFSSNKTPRYNYHVNYKLESLTVPDLLRCWYEKRSQSITSSIKFTQSNLFKEQLELEAQTIILPRLDETIEIIKKHEGTLDELVGILKYTFKEHNLSSFQARKIVDMKLHKISKIDQSQIRNRLVEIEKAIVVESEKFTKVNEIIYNEAAYFKKKYKKPRMTKIPEYLGYIKIGDSGIIQYETEDELLELLNTFSSSTITIYQYVDKKDTRYLVQSNRVIDSPISIPKQTSGNRIISSSKKERYTLLINPLTNTASTIEGTVFESDIVKVFPISKYFYALTNTGNIKLTSVNETSIRKSATASGAKSDIIYGIPESKSNLVLFHMNTEEPNMLRIERILTDTSDKDNLGRVNLSPAGTTEILAAIPLTVDEYILNIPENCVKRMTIEFLKLTCIQDLFKDKNSVFIDLNKTKDSNIKITKHPDCKRMFVI